MRWALLLAFLVTSLGCGHSARSGVPRTHVIAAEGQGMGGSGGRDCHQEQLLCFNRCWTTPPPYPHKKGDGWHHEYCTRTCREAYMECVKEQGSEQKAPASRPLTFSDVDTALSWLREHKAEVALGTVVLVAGVSFVVATGGGGGALLLVPLAW